MTDLAVVRTLMQRMLRHKVRWVEVAERDYGNMVAVGFQRETTPRGFVVRRHVWARWPESRLATFLAREVVSLAGVKRRSGRFGPKPQRRHESAARRRRLR